MEKKGPAHWEEASERREVSSNVTGRGGGGEEVPTTKYEEEDDEMEFGGKGEKER